jgi:hypothetical protein
MRLHFEVFDPDGAQKTEKLHKIGKLKEPD